MTLDELKLRLQQHLSDGLVTIVGLGLSASHGLPTMGELSDHLHSEIPIRLAGASNNDWDRVESQLAAGAGLEAALDAIPHGSVLIPMIVEESASLMIAAETKAIQDTLRAGKPMPFEALVPHLLHATDSAEVITTNYDRLIEIAVEMAGYRVECAFPSAYYSRLDESAAKQQVREWVPVGRSAKRRTQKHVRLSKPHGSLDWYLLANEPVRSVLNLLEPRLMVSPGSSKYLQGYDIPFDLHRGVSKNALTSVRSEFLGEYDSRNTSSETDSKMGFKMVIVEAVANDEETCRTIDRIVRSFTM